jgi:hypothetical protein
LLKVNDTQGTIGIGILATSSSSSPKIKMDGNVQIGNQATTLGSSELAVTGNGSSHILTVENTSSTATDTSVLVVKGPSTTVQLNDTVAPTNSGTYNIVSNTGFLSISSINDNGTNRQEVLRIEPDGQIHMKTGMTIAFDL